MTISKLITGEIIIIIKERPLYLMPLFALGSTRSGRGNDAGEESAKLAALYLIIKDKQMKLKWKLLRSNLIKKHDFFFPFCLSSRQ